MIYEFVANLVKEQVGEKGKIYFPSYLQYSPSLLTNNLIGMIPYSFTTTSHIIVTFTLSLSIFVAVTIIGFQHSWYYIFLVFYYHQEHL
jgi:F0F1-type ATP synthase membrane subunit a